MPLIYNFSILLTGLYSLIVMLSAAYLTMRLIPPRPLKADLIRQPGILFLGLWIVIMILEMLLSEYVDLEPRENIITFLALVLSWLAASRYYRSRVEPGWIEVLGRSVGIGWILITFGYYPLSVLLYN